jgi:hypothetical protein
MMPLNFRSDRTVTNKPELVACGQSQWQDFPQRAQRVADHFGMIVTKKIDGEDERLWLVRLGELQFCISWDIWFPEVCISAWDITPDAEVERLAGTERTR